MRRPTNDFGTPNRLLVCPRAVSQAESTTSSAGERFKLGLKETLGHSGIFTGSITLDPGQKPNPADDKFTAWFGDTITATYKPGTDTNSTAAVTAEIPVARGTDGILASFQKKFSAENIAVETQFRMAECYFELFKNFRALKQQQQADDALRDGMLILKELTEEYGSTAYRARMSYLLAQFAQEFGDSSMTGGFRRAHPNAVRTSRRCRRFRRHDRFHFRIVVVETFFRFAPEHTRFIARLHDEARTVARFLEELAVDENGSRLRDIKAGQFHQLERSHAEAADIAHHAINICKGGNALIDKMRRLEREAAADLIDEEARRIGAAHRFARHAFADHGQCFADPLFGL